VHLHNGVSASRARKIVEWLFAELHRSRLSCDAPSVFDRVAIQPVVQFSTSARRVRFCSMAFLDPQELSRAGWLRLARALSNDFECFERMIGAERSWSPMSSKRRLRRQQCEGKKAFRSAEDARNAAYLVSARTGQRLASYRCKFCRQWHIGHRPRGLPRRLGRR
jgi:hypothetical protein